MAELSSNTPLRRVARGFDSVHGVEGVVFERQFHEVALFKGARRGMVGEKAARGHQKLRTQKLGRKN